MLKETSLIENNISRVVNQPSGFKCTRKTFRVLDFFTSLFRQFRITFLAQLSTFLFMPIVFIVYFTILSNVMAFKDEKRSKCSLNISHSSANCTLEDPFQLNDSEYRNVYYISLVLMFTNIVMISTTTILYTKYLKIFQREHRNCK